MLNHTGWGIMEELGGGDIHRAQPGFRSQTRKWVSRFRQRLRQVGPNFEGFDGRFEKQQKVRLKPTSTSFKGKLKRFYKTSRRWVLRWLPFVDSAAKEKSRCIRVDFESLAKKTKGARDPTNNTVPDAAASRKKYRNNAIHTTKYGPITFLPKNLFEQFQRLANIWFLIAVVIQVRLVLSCV